ncbi:MAG: aminotransferase class V-fold PLP-dependent enzyme [Planctomycetota bacterium]|jgi:aspartate aminotransferase-like enzyme|nr:aminotransferase class V-fold PLP-dependent enzyme [Planctomycetota bacterium]MDP6839533.1 aminotransferase class V-fold PLP-dependent enzyme [Planctomycetota bacterium]MDP6954497.1 aminotransferase class V-fold PLP-dependent enzyme [Planctomycetota bacterium]
MPELWIPGPTEVRHAILEECQRPMVGHRSRAMMDLIAALDPGLALAFGLAPDSTAQVAVHACSASGMMEGSLTAVGPRVLSINGGAFGNRWLTIARALGKDVHEFKVEWGRAPAPQELDAVLTEEGPFDAVTLVSNETSTGVRTPLGPIGEVVKRHGDTLLLVDLVSLIAGAPVDFDANGIDFGLAGVQKAFALPPGICVMAASQRYLEGAREHERGTFYLDPVRIFDGHAKRKPPITPVIGLHYALRRQLADITTGASLPQAARQDSTGPEVAADWAWQARFDKHRRMQERTAAWGQVHGLQLLPPAAEASPTVSCFRAGDLDVAAFVAALGQKGYTISNGYGDLKGKTFRIGHMGDHTEDGLERLLSAADSCLG